MRTIRLTQSEKPSPWVSGFKHVLRGGRVTYVVQGELDRDAVCRLRGRA